MDPSKIRPLLRVTITHFVGSLLDDVMCSRRTLACLPLQKYGYKIQIMRGQNPAKSGKAIKHRILIYGGLGDVATTRIIPALRLLQNECDIEFSLVDIKDEGIGQYYKYGKEPLVDYDSAIVATPNNAHMPVILKALNAGMHVLCEKPLAHTHEAAHKILTVSRGHSKLISMLSEHYVYKPTIREVIQHWKRYQSEIGELVSIKAKILEPPLQKGREWLLDSERSGGGIAMDTGYHIVSVMGKLFGYQDITVKEASMARYPEATGDGETFASIQLVVSGVPVYIDVAKWVAKTQKDITFFGNRGTLRVDIQDGQVILNEKIQKSFSEDDSYAVLLKEFLSAIENQRPPRTTLEEGYEALKVIKSAYAIAKWRNSYYET